MKTLIRDICPTWPSCRRKCDTSPRLKFKADLCHDRADDIVIAVMGVTGAGKSTFINLFANETVVIGNDLQSCERSSLFVV